MNLIVPIVELLVQVGRFVNAERATALQEKVLKLRRMYDEEVAKGENRDDAFVDSIVFELCDLCEVYRSELERQAPKN